MVPLPDIYLVGAPKAATTSLTRWLDSHPDLYFCRPKEPFYWSTDYPRMRAHRGFDTRAAYERLYDSADARRAKHNCDGSTTYLYSETAVPAILQEVPNARFVVTLRNPVDLLNSWHRSQLIGLNEDETDFARAWRRSLDGRAPDADFLDSKRVDYPMMGRLGQAVQRLVDTVPEGAAHFVVFEDVVERPDQVWRSVTEFLGIPAEPVPSFQVHNPSTKMYRFELAHRLKARPPTVLAGPVRTIRQAVWRRRGNPTLKRVRGLLWRGEAKPELPSSLRRELTDYFASDVQLLGELIGRDLSAWSRLSAG
ncbi:MAG: sulfotransferase [Actinomycetota bacterium]|nr:sulfotransferase [Actinomycetota bacterium]